MIELKEIQLRIENIEKQVGILPKPWTVKAKPVLKPLKKK
jgi:hypothetical protein